MNPRQRKRRSSIIEFGTGPARVKIYTMTRSDGYPEFTLAWKEGDRRRKRSFACLEEARLIAQQTTVRLTNGFAAGDEATRRDLEMLRYCEQQAARFGMTLTAAIDEWVNARTLAGETLLSDAIRSHLATRADLVADKTVAQVAKEFLESRKASGVSEAYVRRSGDYLARFTKHMHGPIAEIGVDDINRFLRSQKTLGPVSKNAYRRCLVTMFRFAQRQGYLHPDRKTAAERTETFREPETEVAIFTPEEMEKILLAAHARILPLLAIGAFAGIRTAEIRRLDWKDIKWDRGHIEIAGRKAKTAARRLVPLSDNLRAWLAPWRHETGPIVPITDPSGAMSDVAVKAGIPGGWRQNALRHSFISYRVALTGDVARTALEAGNSPKMIFRHYREIVDEEAARTWFAITPPEGWVPKVLPWPIRDRIRRAVAAHRRKTG
jgi:integrase